MDDLSHRKYIEIIEISDEERPYVNKIYREEMEHINRKLEKQMESFEKFVKRAIEEQLKNKDNIIITKTIDEYRNEYKNVLECYKENNKED